VLVSSHFCTIWEGSCPEILCERENRQNPAEVRSRKEA